MTTVRNLAASERGGIDRRHAVAAADNEGSDQSVGRSKGGEEKLEGNWTNSVSTHNEIRHGHTAHTAAAVDGRLILHIEAQ